jgi:hypothetical protein
MSALWKPGVTAVIPTIPTRERQAVLARRALPSVRHQIMPVTSVIVETDEHGEGAWVTRGRALAKVETEWTAFLDDDDEWRPHHVSSLVAEAERTGADYVFSWFALGINCGSIDRLGHFGRPFDPEHPHPTTMTVLVRTELAQRVGFTPPEVGARQGGEDWRFTLGCVAAGAKIVHLPRRTWVYHCFPGGTHGMPTWTR